MHNSTPASVLRQRPLTALTLAIPLLLAGLSPGYAQPYGGPPPDYSGHRDMIRCASDGDYRHCRADTRDGVRLYRQLSNHACRYNDSWGYDQRGVWVDNGCRGEFQLYAGNSSESKDKKDQDHTAAIIGGVVALSILGAVLSEHDKKSDPGPPANVVRCESDGNYRHCRADIRGRVNVYRQLSRASCRYNDTWGYDRRGVWVDNGCRAEFTLN